MSFSALVINPGYFYFNYKFFEIIEKNYMILLHEKKWLKFVVLLVSISLKELFLFFVSFTITVNDDNKITIIYQTQVHSK